MSGIFFTTTSIQWMTSLKLPIKHSNNLSADFNKRLFFYHLNRFSKIPVINFDNVNSFG